MTNDKALTFIPSSVNKFSSNTNKNQSANNNNNKSSNDEITKTITITATSYNIHHHTNDDPQNVTPPPSSCTDNNQKQTSLKPEPGQEQDQEAELDPESEPEPIKLRPLPSLDAKAGKSVLRKSQFTTFRDEKRNKRRSNKSSSKDKDNNKDGTDIENKRKSVSFTTDVKKEDGVSAKFYSSPQYLIRDGTYLRPKPREQIENEKRLLQMLGAPEELAGRALPQGLLDEDWEEQYDPQQPNDYTAFVNARQRLDEWIQMRKVKKYNKLLHITYYMLYITYYILCITYLFVINLSYNKIQIFLISISLQFTNTILLIILAPNLCIYVYI